MKEKLLKIQQELKAPKNQRNDFGKYNYRSCEDILEAIKPLLKEVKLILTLNDELVYLGDRYYIKATATLTDIESDASISNIAYAREEETKKGMDGSQITGASSSYARKYALNGLFLIDDVKDSDATNTGEKSSKSLEDTEHLMLISKFNNLAEETNLNREALYEKLGVSSNSEIPNDKLKDLIEQMKKKVGSK